MSKGSEYAKSLLAMIHCKSAKKEVQEEAMRSFKEIYFRYPEPLITFMMGCFHLEGIAGVMEPSAKHAFVNFTTVSKLRPLVDKAEEILKGLAHYKIL